LLIRSSSLIPFTIFMPEFSSGSEFDYESRLRTVAYIYIVICQVFSHKLTKVCINCAYIGHNKRNWHYILYLPEGKLPAQFLGSRAFLPPERGYGPETPLQMVLHEAKLVFFRHPA
jgi:hypothetical protein